MTSRMTRLAIAVAVVSLAAPVAGATACKQYFILGSVSALVSRDPSAYVHFDASGVPVVAYPFGTHETPFVTAEWGLQNYSWWCRRQFADDDALPRPGWRAQALAEALRMADHLVATQSTDGAWFYSFPFQAGNLQLQPPWPSAISQGVAISLLARAYAVSGNPRYLRAAVRALRPFSRPYQAHGVRDVWDSHPWYEEYPGQGAQHVLNGFEFGMVGLSDLAPYSGRARRLLAAGLRSLVWALPKYDLGDRGSSYGYRWGVASYGYSGYLHWHVLLTRALYLASGEPVLERYADRWQKVLRAHGYDAP